MKTTGTIQYSREENKEAAILTNVLNMVISMNDKFDGMIVVFNSPLISIYNGNRRLASDLVESVMNARKAGVELPILKARWDRTSRFIHF